MTTVAPLRAVAKAVLHEGSSAIANFTLRWWELRLSCGHMEERPARYEPGASKGRRGFARMHHPPPKSAVLSAPGRARCSSCRQG